MDSTPRKIGANIGIVKDDSGRLLVGLEVFGKGHATICLTARHARVYANALGIAADKLEEMAPELVEKSPS